MSNSADMSFNLRNSAGLRIMVLFGSFFIFICLSSWLNEIINNSGLTEKTKYLLESAIQCILVFCLPAFFTAKFASEQPETWLRLSKTGSWKGYLGVIIVFILGIPLMNFIITWNENIHFPESLSTLESSLRDLENSSKEITDLMLKKGSALTFIISLLVVGLLTGFSEEIFFRGALLRIFLQTQTRKNLAIWLVAFLFSFFHFQFFGFIPRMVLGAFFGYLLVWSNSLWMPVFAHALNNSIVIFTYQFEEPNEMVDQLSPLEGNFLLPFMSLLAITIFFIYFRKYFFYKKSD